jgi:hypothetical protein
MGGFEIDGFVTANPHISGIKNPTISHLPIPIRPNVKSWLDRFNGKKMAIWQMRRVFTRTFPN